MELEIAYALLEAPVGELFVACMGGKVVYASLVGCDADIGVKGSFCAVNNLMEQGVTGLRKFLKAKKVQRYKLAPNYDHVSKVVHSAYKGGCPAAFFVLHGAEFQKKVWMAVIKIKSGKVVTYSKLAEMVGHPKAVRAVANAVAANNIAYLIPCHRIVRSDGSCGGYRWGEQMKKQLIASESVNEDD